MTRAHLARRSAALLGALMLSLVVLSPEAAHASVVAPRAPANAQITGTGCPTISSYAASNGFFLDYPYIAGQVSGYGFGHGYPFYGTPFPVWDGGFGYVPYTYYPAVGTPSAGVAPGFQHPINAYHPAPFPVGPSAPAGVPYYAGYPYPPSYPVSSYP